MTRRRLRPDEIALWRRVADTTERLHPKRPDPEPAEAPGKPLQPRPVSFRPGEAAEGKGPGHDVLPHLQDRLAAAPLNMDRKTFGRLKRGKMVPEARLDLHGMTLDQAHPALAAFIMRAQAQGKRLVLVITGKGKSSDDGGPIPVRHGVLRHAVPQWLSVPPLAQAVLQISEAHLKHGGTGAYYVYLRRSR